MSFHAVVVEIFQLLELLAHNFTAFPRRYFGSDQNGGQANAAIEPCCSRGKKKKKTIKHSITASDSKKRISRMRKAEETHVSATTDYAHSSEIPLIFCFFGLLCFMPSTNVSNKKRKPLTTPPHSWWDPHSLIPREVDSRLPE